MNLSLQPHSAGTAVLPTRGAHALKSTCAVARGELEIIWVN